MMACTTSFLGQLGKIRVGNMEIAGYVSQIEVTAPLDYGPTYCNVQFRGHSMTTIPEVPKPARGYSLIPPRKSPMLKKGFLTSLYLAAVAGGALAGYGYAEKAAVRATQNTAATGHHGHYELNPATGEVEFKWHKLTPVGPDGRPVLSPEF